MLRCFAGAFPTVQLRLHVEALATTNGLVLDGRAGIGTSGPLLTEFDRCAASAVTMVPVAASGHETGEYGACFAWCGRNLVHLVLTDRSH